MPKYRPFGRKTHVKLLNMAKSQQCGTNNLQPVSQRFWLHGCEKPWKHNSLLCHAFNWMVNIHAQVPLSSEIPSKNIPTDNTAHCTRWYPQGVHWTVGHSKMDGRYKGPRSGVVDGHPSMNKHPETGGSGLCLSLSGATRRLRRTWKLWDVVLLAHIEGATLLKSNRSKMFFAGIWNGFL